MESSKSVVERKGCCAVNWPLVPAKAVEFFKCGGESMWSRFILLHLRNIGMTTSETGIIAAVSPFVTFLASPLFGGFADKYNKHKSTFVVSCVLAVGCILSMLFVPAKDKYPPMCTTNETTDLAASLLTNKTIMLTSLVNEYIECNVENAIYPCEGVDGVSNSYSRIICANYTTTTESTVVTTYNNELHNCLREFIQKTCALNKDSKIVTSRIVLMNPKYYESLPMKGCIHNIFRSKCDQNDTRFMQEFDNNEFKSTFWMVLSIYAIGSVFLSPVSCLIYAMIYSVLGDSWDQWGKLRLWGSVSTVFSAIVTTLLLDVYSKNQTDIPYEICFYIFGIATVLCGFSMILLKVPRKLSTKRVWKGSLELTKSFKNISFFLNVTVFGAYMGASGFLLWHVTEQNQLSTASETKQIIFGVYIALDSLLEIPLLYVSGWVVRRLGHLGSMEASAVVYGVRFISYSYIYNPWFILLVAPLNPISYGLFGFTYTSYANLIAPPELAGVSQGIVGGLYHGLGYGCGILLTGLLFDKIGGVWTYRLYACSSFGILLPFLVMQWFLFNKRNILRAAEDVNDEYDLVPISKNPNADRSFMAETPECEL